MFEREREMKTYLVYLLLTCSIWIVMPPLAVAKPKPANVTTVVAPKVIISDIAIATTGGGQLEPALTAKIRQVLTVKIGQPVTRTQLEQDLKAVKALGDFATVQIIPEDTAKGVKVSILVKPYGTLKQVQIRTLPANGDSILTAVKIDQIFQPQYGKRLNAIELKAAIEKLDRLYQQLQSCPSRRC
jgi:outer membrane protein insertion porin family